MARRERDPSPKHEALRALQHVLNRLRSPDRIEPLDQRTLAAALEYAFDQMTAVQELKRPRVAGNGSTAPPSASSGRSGSRRSATGARTPSAAEAGGSSSTT